MKIKRTDDFKSNDRSANIYYAQGKLNQLGGYICYGDYPINFIVSGEVTGYERYEPVREYIGKYIGHIPIIILHNNNMNIEHMLYNVCQVSRPKCPVWVVNNQNRQWEPFFGMSDMQVISILRKLAEKMNYSLSPSFQRVAMAHFDILRLLKLPMSLSGLHYLCKFRDMGEFHENILALPCDQSRAMRIWADLGTDLTGGDNQFDLFRTIIMGFANAAFLDGWNPDNNICDRNIAHAVNYNAVYAMPINESQSELILTYITEEMKMAGRPFIIITDGIKLQDEYIADYLTDPNNNNFFYGAIGRNIAESFGQNENMFKRLCAKTQYIILFKHATSATASKFSEVIGNYDAMKSESTYGRDIRHFSLMPRDNTKTVSYSIENRNRVKPDAITRLESNQAIVFNTNNDQVIFYNV